MSEGVIGTVGVIVLVADGDTVNSGNYPVYLL